MNELEAKEDTKIEDMIFEVKEKEVMLATEISRTKCKNHLYDKMKFTMILQNQHLYLAII